MRLDKRPDFIGDRARQGFVAQNDIQVLGAALAGDNFDRWVAFGAFQDLDNGSHVQAVDFGCQGAGGADFGGDFVVG